MTVSQVTPLLTGVVEPPTLLHDLPRSVAQSIAAENVDGRVHTHEDLLTRLNIFPTRTPAEIQELQGDARDQANREYARRCDEDYRSGIKRIKNILLTEHQMDFVNERQVGYKVLPPREQIYAAVRDMTRSLGERIKKGGLRLKHIRVHALSQPDQQLLQEERNKAASMRAAKENLYSYKRIRRTKHS